MKKNPNRKSLSYKRHQKGRHKYIWALAAFLFVAAIFIAIYFLVINFKITNVKCLGLNFGCPEGLILSLNDFENKPYGQLESDLSAYLSDTKYISSFVLQFKLPSTVEIEVEFKQPLFMIEDAFNKKTYMFSEDNTVVEYDLSGKSIDLPVIRINEDISTWREKTDFEYVRLLILKLNYLRFSSLIEFKDDYYQSRINSIEVKFPGVGDADYMIGSLRIIFSRLNDSNQGITMDEISGIDLRYKNPILQKYIVNE